MKNIILFSLTIFTKTFGMKDNNIKSYNNNQQDEEKELEEQKIKHNLYQIFYPLIEINELINKKKFGQKVNGNNSNNEFDNDLFDSISFSFTELNGLNVNLWRELKEMKEDKNSIIIKLLNQEDKNSSNILQTIREFLQKSVNALDKIYKELTEKNIIEHNTFIKNFILSDIHNSNNYTIDKIDKIKLYNFMKEQKPIEIEKPIETQKPKWKQITVWIGIIFIIAGIIGRGFIFFDKIFDKTNSEKDKNGKEKTMDINYKSNITPNINELKNKAASG